MRQVRFDLRLLFAAMVIMLYSAGWACADTITVSVNLDRAGCHLCNEVKSEMAITTVHAIHVCCPMYDVRLVAYVRAGKDLKRIRRWAAKLVPGADIVLVRSVPFDGLRVLAGESSTRTWETDRLFDRDTAEEIIRWIQSML